MNKLIAITVGVLIVLLIQSCVKEQEISEDPYAGGKDALGIRFLEENLEDNLVSPGELLTFKVSGVSSNMSQGLSFLLNGEQAEIEEYTDSTVTIRVPHLVSSGAASILSQNQLFFGPRVEINGNVSIDDSFNSLNGSNGSVLDYVPFQDGYLFGGAFSNYADMASATNFINNIAQVTADGTYQANPNFGRGTNGVVNSMQRLGNGQYILAGSFSTFNRRTGINSITRLNASGSLDSMIVDLVNLDPINASLRSVDTVAAFNGGVSGTILKTFITVDPIKGEMITAIGHFSEYGRYFYPRSTWDFKVLERTKINQVVRLDYTGKMDSSYNFDADLKVGYPGGNGEVLDGYMQSDGKLILVGNFTTFHGQAANRIVRLNTDGTVDPTFTSTGADGAIARISYNEISGKLTLLGNFSTFNGRPANQIVRISIDGEVDESLTIKSFEGGLPNFAYQLKDGRTIVAGNFVKYDGVTRRGFVVLDPTGEAHQSNNNIGAFSGIINNVIETTSVFGHPAVILMGYITTFDDQLVRNVVKVELKNNL